MAQHGETRYRHCPRCDRWEDKHTFRRARWGSRQRSVCRRCADDLDQWDRIVKSEEDRAS